MRKLKMVQHLSLDGVMQSSDDGDGFPYADWTAPYRTLAGRELVLSLYGERFDLLLGRRTYDLWAGFWPTAPASAMTDRLNGAVKYVATYRPDTLGWGPAEGVGPDVAEGVRRLLASEGPNLVVSGSSTLTATLLEQALVEELALIQYPVLLGTGKRLFAQGLSAHSFRLRSSTATPSGVLLNVYEAAGRLRTAEERTASA